MGTTKAVFKGKVIIKTDNGYLLEGVTYPTLTAATAAIK